MPATLVVYRPAQWGLAPIPHMGLGGDTLDKAARGRTAALSRNSVLRLNNKGAIHAWRA